jgi:hypothetical protein
MRFATPVQQQLSFSKSPHWGHYEIRNDRTASITKIANAKSDIIK